MKILNYLRASAKIEADFDKKQSFQKYRRSLFLVIILVVLVTINLGINLHLRQTKFDSAKFYFYEKSEYVHVGYHGFFEDSYYQRAPARNVVERHVRRLLEIKDQLWYFYTFGSIMFLFQLPASWSGKHVWPKTAKHIVLGLFGISLILALYASNLLVLPS